MKVLVVDDALFTRKVLSKKLSKLGHNVFEAKDGEEAVLKSMREKPDVVFMDIMMPNMDGITATKLIKKNSKSRVVMCTSMNNKSHLIAALKAGASDYLIKPFDDEKLHNSLYKEW